ncbi:hypothetical protein [Candidatus Poriferisodalis sp.]|uniref:hypothetical protein n=1 Tax=Candidatus Poriferisodalis sp. TaxID=3101277 RepID=UPI003B5A34F8
MELSALAQVGTMVLAALAIVWHQQRSSDKLRDDMSAQITGIRDELRGELGGVRGEISGVRGELGTVRSIVVENGQRLARIEGYLGIGMPSEAATAAAGVRVAQQAKLPSTEEASEAP